uniref:Retinal cone rhodopsin-sensitive cGMP 3',5'-cyclic phosphodiesterase subunit gamma n=1 Tax=Ornithorhynchus anatinus TaxID=9258 RepID=A0A6I8MYY5_ORNAN
MSEAAASSQGPSTPRRGPPKFKQRQTRQFKSKPPKRGVKGFGDDIPGMEGLGTGEPGGPRAGITAGFEPGSLGGTPALSPCPAPAPSVLPPRNPSALPVLPPCSHGAPSPHIPSVLPRCNSSAPSPWSLRATPGLPPYAP